MAQIDLKQEESTRGEVWAAPAAFQAADAVTRLTPNGQPAGRLMACCSNVTD